MVNRATLTSRHSQPAQNGSHQPALEQRVLGGEVNPATAGGDDQDRIDQRVRMIAGEQHAAGRRNVIQPDDLDLAKEHAGRDAEKPRQNPIHHTAIVSNFGPRRGGDAGRPRPIGIQGRSGTARHGSAKCIDRFARCVLRCDRCSALALFRIDPKSVLIVDCENAQMRRISASVTGREYRFNHS